jgi:hypothetical protein
MDTLYTEDQKAAFKAEFGRRRRRHIASIVAVVSMLVAGILAFGLRFATSPWFFVIGAVFVISSAGNWRCPACRRPFYEELTPKFCSRCGVALE